jgi:hypothetical protein
VAFVWRTITHGDGAGPVLAGDRTGSDGEWHHARRDHTLVLGLHFGGAIYHTRPRKMSNRYPNFANETKTLTHLTHGGTLKERPSSTAPMTTHNTVILRNRLLAMRNHGAGRVGPFGM